MQAFDMLFDHFEEVFAFQELCKNLESKDSSLFKFLMTAITEDDLRAMRELLTSTVFKQKNSIYSRQIATVKLNKTKHR